MSSPSLESTSTQDANTGKRLFAAFASGLLFGLGLAISGMTRPQKVLSFLDLTGAWDPSLLFVLGSAVTLTAIGFHLLQKRKQPLFDASFHLPTKRSPDKALIGGSILFGIGWGISGYCPGPALALLAQPQSSELWVFLPAVLVGWLIRNAFVTSQRAEAAAK